MIKEILKQDEPNLMRFAKKVVKDTTIEIVLPDWLNPKTLTIDYNLTNVDTTPNETVSFETENGSGAETASKVYMYFIGKVGVYNAKLNGTTVSFSVYSDRFMFKASDGEVTVYMGSKENSVEIPITIYDDNGKSNTSLIRKYSLSESVDVDVTADIRNIPTKWPIKIDVLGERYTIPTNDTEEDIYGYLNNGFLTNIREEILSGGFLHLSLLTNMKQDEIATNVAWYDDGGMLLEEEHASSIEDYWTEYETHYPRTDVCVQIEDNALSHMKLFQTNSNVTDVKVFHGCDLHSVIFINELGGWSQIVASALTEETAINKLNTFNTYDADMRVRQTNLGNEMNYNKKLVKLCCGEQMRAVGQMMKSKFVYLDDFDHPIILDKMKVTKSDGVQTVEIPFHDNNKNLS